ncbi:MAG TPA: TetR/AcrR family transcriptional regulator [Acidimicrobiales bacterium]|nr:TetR/AcrR family transcriptional regulator [Acidimicrobiales bacterium]
MQGGKLGSASRRAALLDVAAELLAEVDIEEVSVEAVADRAGVSRALVYKHFANRRDILGSLYEREAASLRAQLSAEVEAATSVEEMLRVLVRGALTAEASRGTTLSTLLASGFDRRGHPDRRRRRDGAALRYFAARIADELQLEPAAATAGAALVLGAIRTVLAGWRRRPTPDQAEFLEYVYVTLAMGGLQRLAEDQVRRDVPAPVALG